jgi:hypothetical protein|tara:strand:- start:5893 stop:7416 length:1524 start_codon:yes stop_codon:yes gene_type:complete
MNTKINILHEDCPPRADSILQSLRSFGYDTATAIADLIDNSISAKSKNIWVIQKYSRADSWIAILDDGAGMSEKELREAMRMGSKNPLEERDITDLGRFGLGLKTASLSQCRRLTVRSKRNTKVFTRCWDLDVVSETKNWSLLKKAYNKSEERLKSLKNVENGTIVLWENMDRVVGEFEDMDEHSAKESFQKIIQGVNKYISMVFHRFIGFGGKLNIYVCTPDTIGKDNIKIKGWDPFVIDHKATNSLPEEPLSKTDIIMKGYVLPHFSKLNDLEHQNAGGMYGWNAHQGFYLYRNKRLIVPGTWLSTGYKKEDHYKLARIQIDIPNTEDNRWKIDVTKSEVLPPADIAAKLKRYAMMVRKEAVKVYRFRGKTISRTSSLTNLLIWKIKTLRNKTKYYIDKKHPLVDSIINKTGGNKKYINQLLKLVQETIPIPAIVVNNSADPESHEYEHTLEDFEDLGIKKKFLDIIKKYEKDGLNHDEAVKRAMETDPFDKIPEILAYVEDRNE